MVITPVGDVKLCSLLGIVIGNIKEKKIREILSDPRKTKEIDMIRETKWGDLKKECRECKEKKFCIRCPAINLLEREDFFGPSEINCVYAKARKGVEELNEKNIL